MRAEAFEGCLQLVSLGQKRHPEVERALLLPEPAPRDCADACVLEEAEGVEGVGRVPFSLGCCDGLGREMDLWERVHGPLHRRKRGEREERERRERGGREEGERRERGGGEEGEVMGR